MTSILIRSSVLSLITILIYPVSTFAYSVVLKSGKQISGTLIFENENVVKIKDERGVEISFKKQTLDLEKMKRLQKQEEIERAIIEKQQQERREKVIQEILKRAEEKKNADNTLKQIVDASKRMKKEESTFKPGYTFTNKDAGAVPDKVTILGEKAGSAEIDMVQPETNIGPHPHLSLLDNCEGEHQIDWISDGGEFIKLDDGSLWQVDSLDTTDSSLWESMADVIVCDDRLINVDDEEVVTAVRLELQNIPTLKTYPAQELTWETISLLEGAFVIANDGKYLGKITSNQFDPDSIGRTYGPYGSRFSSDSIRNQYGTYGSRFSNLSPFNDYSSDPPVIILNGSIVAYLTTNRFKSPRLDPKLLLVWLERQK